MAATYEKIDRRDLKHMDGSAFALVRDAQCYGWSVAVNSSRDGATLRSPDGGTTIRVGRGSRGAGSVQRNRVALDRWLKGRGVRHG